MFLTIIISHSPVKGGVGMRSPHLTSLWPHLFTPFTQKMSEVLTKRKNVDTQPLDVWLSVNHLLRTCLASGFVTRLMNIQVRDGCPCVTVTLPRHNPRAHERTRHSSDLA